MVSLLLALMALVAPLNVVGPVGAPAPANVVGPIPADVVGPLPG